MFEQEIYHGSTVDLNLPLYGGNFAWSINQNARNVVVTSKFILITVGQYADFDRGIILGKLFCNTCIVLLLGMDRNKKKHRKAKRKKEKTLETKKEHQLGLYYKLKIKNNYFWETLAIFKMILYTRN